MSTKLTGYIIVWIIGVGSGLLLARSPLRSPSDVDSHLNAAVPELRSPPDAFVSTQVDAISQAITIRTQATASAIVEEPSGTDMATRRSQGEFFLASEKPDYQKSLTAMRAQRVAELKERSEPAYNGLFQSFGLPRKTQEQLVSHLEKIADASLQAGLSLDQLVTATSAYDQRMKSLLTDDQYRQYREFEDGQSARQEFDNFTKFFALNKDSIDAGTEKVIVDLMRETGAYTQRWQNWGPYDDPPRVTQGYDPVADELEKELAAAKAGADALASRSADAGLSDRYKELLSNYYASMAEQKQSLIGALRQHRRFPRSGGIGATSPAP